MVLYLRYILLGKNGVISGSALRQKVRLLCTHILYSTYHMVGRSIASIYDLGGIFTSALRGSITISPQVIYIGYGPPYLATYILQNSCINEYLQLYLHAYNDITAITYDKGITSSFRHVKWNGCICITYSCKHFVC